MSGSGKASRLHPKLRLIGNGSDAINFRRAELSSIMVSTMKAPPIAAKMADQLRRPDVLLAPGNEAAFAKPKKPKKRGKLTPARQARNAFVNVFIELQRGGSSATADSSAGGGVEAELHAMLRRHKGMATAQGGILSKRNFIAATVPVSELPKLSADPRISFIQPADRLAYQLPRPKTGAAERRRPSSRATASANSGTGGAGIIIGIIDVGGFDFSHPDFSDGHGGTRFLAIWDQGGTFRSPPKGMRKDFTIGSEFTKKHLDAAMKAAAKKGGLAATALEPQSQATPGSHGTHVASIAAGGSGVCPKATIAAVLIDIPRQSSANAERRTAFCDSNRIVQAVEYLLEIARREKKPISINISLGTNGGAHDGSTGVSRWLDALLATEGRAICVAAGNAGQEKGEAPDDIGWIMGRIHGSGQIAAAGLAAELEWTVVGNGIVDVSENEMEIWYSAQDRFSVHVRPPGETRWISVEPRQFIENRRLASGTFLSVYNELYHPVNGANYIGLYLSPDLNANSPKGVQSGVWTIRLEGEEVRHGEFHCWIERDDPYEFDRVGERRVARFPSFFSERSNVDSHSINSLACGHRVIAVANLDADRQRINNTSSQGPTRDNRMKPDIAAPGTNILAAAGFTPGDAPWIRMSGTSMASPYVTGVVGLMLSVNPTLTAAQCTGILQRTSRPLPGADYTWRNDMGYGQVDAQAAVEEAKTYDQRADITKRGGRP
jgi:subtilisin family serine protease